MAIIETVQMGNWIRSLFESPKSHNTYEIYSHWEESSKCWVAVSCTCEGFKNRATCRHLKEIGADLVGLARPLPADDDIKLKTGFWYECPICGGVEFMIKPAVDTAFLAFHELLCSRCGRLFKL